MSSIVVSGDTSGAITISAPAVAGTNTLTLPAVTDTLTGIAATQTLTNKTLTSPTIATPTMTGQATIPTINLTGGQITFPATQSASSDANTLDDYEEGVWSASAITTSNCTSVSFTEGRYTKIGNIVSIQGKFTLTVTTANTLTYVAMLTPFTSLYTTSGSVMDNQSVVSGSGQVSNNGYAYAFFASSALLPSGITQFFVNYQYQV
jgi:hypothetical protein